MNMEQAAELLRHEGIPIINNNNCIQEEVLPHSNYSQLKLNKDKWLYGVWMIERENNPYLDVEEEFNSEDEGAKYFFIDLLSSHYFSKYVEEFMMNHPEFGIGRDTFDERGLLTAMSLLSIPSSYLIKDKNEAKNRAILLDRDDDTTVISLVNPSGQIAKSSLPIKNHRALFFAFKGIYKLYLFEKKVSPLLEPYNLRNEFSDEDIFSFIF
ncbi:hypothetical protein P6709_10000 [Jeotgalibacillus sp. ET6]|uniref:hypothetical protein n=1 Tax=Jeotgalibacillus sp. ET6 TaxID=3037260 RepID=UPI00241858DB|nr:hypothetical protein [Jeotgalibacillus sp. ET6]MDG5472084.1 hypothetical protein [Jeotgalibacillus sp. ET6]